MAARRMRRAEEKLMRRAYRTELHVNNTEQDLLMRCAGAARFVFNWALADRISRRERREKTNKFEQKRRFNALKGSQYPWLYDLPYTIVEAEFDHLDVAFKNFFRRVKQGEPPGFPQFKDRRHQSFTLRGALTVETGRIKLPKLGWLRLAESGYLPTAEVKILFVTLSLETDHWMISLQVEEADKPTPRHEPDRLAVHLGVAKLATLSNGRQFENPKNLLRYEKKLAHLQRGLSRKELGSQNRRKAKLAVAKCHRRISNTRRFALHEVSHYVAKHSKAHKIIIQDFHVQEMVEGVPVSHDLNKRIHDAAMGELRRQVQYKATWQGKEVVLVPQEAPVSQRCSNCGTLNTDLKLGQRSWECPVCGTTHDREWNAIANLLHFSEIGTK